MRTLVQAVQRGKSHTASRATDRVARLGHRCPDFPVDRAGRVGRLVRLDQAVRLVLVDSSDVDILKVFDLSEGLFVSSLTIAHSHNAVCSRHSSMTHTRVTMPSAAGWREFSSSLHSNLPERFGRTVLLIIINRSQISSLRTCPRERRSFKTNALVNFSPSQLAV